jgi:hypothetical protein
MGSRLPELLDDAVTRGLITSAQRTQLLALQAESAPEARGSLGDRLSWAREVPRGFNAITIAYAVGALIVLFALGWFLADRWDVLGPPGILAVSLVYLALFGTAARLFDRERFTIAHGVAWLFVAATVPLTLWAFLRAIGWWEVLPAAACSADAGTFWVCSGRTVVLAASTFAAALVGLRRVTFGPLMLPGAIALAIMLGEVISEIARGGGPGVPGWPQVVVASLLVAVAYETDRRQGVADLGRWLHIVAAVVTIWALVALFDTDASLRPWLFPTALAMIIASLYLRRVIWLVLGLLAMFNALVWLAREIFKDAVAFPVVLGFVGLLVIVATVVVQRYYPGLAARVRGEHGARPYLPGGSALLLAPAVVAILLFPVGRREAAWAAEWRAADDARMRIVGERERERPPARPRRLGDDVPVRALPLPDSIPPDTLAVPDDSTEVLTPPDSAAAADDTTGADSVSTDSLRVPPPR